MNEYKRYHDAAIKVIGKDKCTGCFKCSEICNSDAIHLEFSSEGFYIPVVDEDKCSHCGLCAEKCPTLCFKSENYGEETLQTFGGFSNHEAVRYESSSGGVFTEIASYILKNKGAVFGAAWGENLSLSHICVEEESDLWKLRSSKYVQSNLENTYGEIKNLLKIPGKKILFSGTPCQVAAIKSTFNCENLYTIDLVCHGVPSKLVFDEYIKWASKGKKVNSYTFRDKSMGWSKYMVKMKIENGEAYESITKQDPFFHGFICDLYSNKSCYDCKFSSIPRVGDLTLGDFWGVSPDLMDERGVSVILANNEKALRLLESLQEEGSISLFKRKLSEAKSGNPRIYNGFLDPRIKREEILNTINENGFSYIMENYINKTQRYVKDELSSDS